MCTAAGARLTNVCPRSLQSAITSTTPQSAPASAGADPAAMQHKPAAPLPVGTAGKQRMLIAGYPAVSFQARPHDHGKAARHPVLLCCACTHSSILGMHPAGGTV